MSFTPPEVALVQAAFPEAQDLSFHRKGGFKAVYRCRTEFGTEAFKLLCLPAVAPTAQDRAAQESARREHLYRAHREIDLLGRVASPEVVKLGSIRARLEQIGGVAYLGYSEEWVDGMNLWELIQAPERTAPDERECVSLLRALVNAIQGIWALDTVHRDIKPLNVMRTANERRRFVLLDLGIAYDVSEPGLTYNTALIPATFRYLAPEMTEARFRDRLDFRSDLYTSGLTVYEFATGRHPIACDSHDMIRTVTRILREPPQPLTRARPDFSERFCSLVDQLLRKQPMLRPGNLALLQRRLETLL